MKKNVNITELLRNRIKMDYSALLAGILSMKEELDKL